MEPIRVQVDAYLLGLIRQELLPRNRFFEQPDGNCRLTTSVAIQLSETARIWREALGPFAEWITQTLWSVTSAQSRTAGPATRLTQRHKQEAKGMLNGPSATPSDSHRYPQELPKPVRPKSQDGIARARRAQAQSQQAAARKAWNPLDKSGRLDRRFYREQIQPRLSGISIPSIMSALAVSQPYATNIPAG